MINNGKDFIVLDIETTGFSPLTEEIIEIAAVKVCGKTLEVLDTFELLVESNKNIPPFITNLTGITNRMVQESGIEIEIALTMLSKFSKDLNVFAHYSPFDKGFIRENLKKHSIDFETSEWFDTIDLFKAKWPGRKTYKLESLIVDFNLASKEDHRALSDTMHTLKLMKITREN
ncbi:PolC-type DNA polymerase III [Mycoplasma marinum]|uniref:Exonuclease domain-containing protein n=1 Tax=Mycoplasma marinum TaxID=1937190 RepID=A0A4R0XL20_9MOLU|nr:3'-5' exonuclease [Mycoplasma marinum]TCG11356.1 hypothetical protein C4B24_02280 [Mycoplasma marinum]